MLTTQDKAIDIFVASRIGSFKHIKYHTDPTKNNKKCIENLIDIKNLQKDDTITSMVWGDEDQTDILIGKKNQKIQIYNTERGGVIKCYTADFGSGYIVGLGRCKRKILAALSSGVVKIWSKKEEVLVDTGGKLDRMRICIEDPTIFATGGEENDLKIWKIGEINPTFVAKNLAHDWLELRRAVWVSDLTFMPTEGGRLVAVCSRHGYARLYDTRAQRRPVCNVDFEGMAATSMTPSFEQRQILVGFGRGQLHQVDLRVGRLDKGFKGCVGAVTDIVTLLGQSGRRLVVSTSLDRQLRVHDYHSKEMVYKQYLTSKLSCVLVQTKSSTPLRNGLEQEVKEEEEEEKETEGENDKDDLDELFDKMETVGEVRKNKLPSDELEPRQKKVKPSTEGSTAAELDDSNAEDAIVKLLRSTEKQKKKMEKKKKEKKASEVRKNKLPSDELEPRQKKVKPSTEGSTAAELDDSNAEDAIVKLLRSTEKQKKKMEKKKKEKKARSVFHNA